MHLGCTIVITCFDGLCLLMVFPRFFRCILSGKVGLCVRPSVMSKNQKWGNDAVSKGVQLDIKVFSLKRVGIDVTPTHMCFGPEIE